jgi:hypothetical protein
MTRSTNQASAAIIKSRDAQDPVPILVTGRELRAAGWPAPEDPDSREDAELGGRDSIADLLSDEVSWLRQCAGWLADLRIPIESVRPFRSNPYSGSGVFVHLVARL